MRTLNDLRSQQFSQLIHVLRAKKDKKESNYVNALVSSPLKEEIWRPSFEGQFVRSSLFFYLPIHIILYIYYAKNSLMICIHCNSLQRSGEIRRRTSSLSRKMVFICRRIPYWDGPCPLPRWTVPWCRPRRRISPKSGTSRCLKEFKRSKRIQDHLNKS